MQPLLEESEEADEEVRTSTASESDEKRIAGDGKRYQDSVVKESTNHCRLCHLHRHPSGRTFELG